MMEVIETTPKDVIKFGTESADILRAIVKSQENKVVINGKQYLQFHDWQTIARFFNCSVGTEWSKALIGKDGEITGYEAKATVIDSAGRIISSAESSCSRDEENWNKKPDFQLRSMAQTRANVKALRNVFSWVVVLSGFEATPAEEMDEQRIRDVTPKQAYKCEGKGCGISITKRVNEYSIEKFNTPLCIQCQAKILEKIQ